MQYANKIRLPALISWLAVFVSLFLWVNASVRSSHPIQLKLANGSIQGELLKLGSQEYTVYKGIPYAEPPIGPLRFKRPIRRKPWKSVLNTTNFPPLCPQILREYADSTFYKTKMSEDCLYLNVFCRPPFSNQTLPVIVFIHGGGYQMGSSADYDQTPILQHFVSRNVLFVTFNYRLGPFGFLATGDDLLPGNNGLWDILLALDWVQQNIHVFKGNKNSVTLMGHGSGAAAASILALSPRGVGLFHKVILMSGTALSPGSVRSVAVNATWKLQEHMRCRAYNSTELLKCLETWSRSEILDSNIPRVFYDDYQEWVPIIDGFGGVIPEAPELLAGYRRKVPLMLGTTRDESILNLVLLNKKGVNMTTLSKDVAEYLVRNLTSQYEGFTNHKLITEGCYYEYVHTRATPGYLDELKDGILNMYSHFWYTAPTALLASFYGRGRTPVYLYSFDHISDNVFSEHNEWIGAFHGSDLIFLFDAEVSYLETRRDKNWQVDRRVTELFADLMVNFARTGNPTPAENSVNFNWTEFSETHLNYLSITDSPEMRAAYHWRGHAFWNWYARHLDAVDVGNLRRIARLENKLGDFQLATWILLCLALFFFAILIGLACYCTRKDADEDDL